MSEIELKVMRDMLNTYNELMQKVLASENPDMRAVYAYAGQIRQLAEDLSVN